MDSLRILHELGSSYVTLVRVCTGLHWHPRVYSSSDCSASGEAGYGALRCRRRYTKYRLAKKQLARTRRHVTCFEGECHL